MKTYSILYAEDVPHYGTVEIDDAAALDAAKALDFSEITNDPERENSVCKRIVYIEGPDGNTLHQDVPLDDYVLRSGGEKERRLCDAAPDLLDALKAPDLDLAHDRLSEFLEDPDASNDDIRDAAIEMGIALNAHSEKRRSAILRATGEGRRRREKRITPFQRKQRSTQ